MHVARFYAAQHLPYLQTTVNFRDWHAAAAAVCFSEGAPQASECCKTLPRQLVLIRELLQ